MNDAQEVGGWFRKGDSDLHTARQMLDSDPPEPDVVAFHSQQAVEKYLKGVLARFGVDAPRTHDLVLLMDLIGEHDDGFEPFREQAGPLGHLAVEVRYPFEWVDREVAAKALESAERICRAVRDRLADLT